MTIENNAQYIEVFNELTQLTKMRAACRQRGFPSPYMDERIPVLHKLVADYEVRNFRTVRGLNEKEFGNISAN